MRRLLVLALVFSLSGSPALAQSLQTAPPKAAPSMLDLGRAEVAKLAAAQAGAYRPGGMSPAYFWTSIGLMAGGGLYLLTGAALKDESSLCDEVEDDLDLDLDCGIGTGVMVVGAGMLGAGALVYFLGRNKARAAGNPQIVFTPKGFAVRSRFGF